VNRTGTDTECAVKHRTGNRNNERQTTIKSWYRQNCTIQAYVREMSI